jgi:hypothetical protein
MKSNEENSWLWVLFDKKGKILYKSDNIADVFRKGDEYPYEEVIIEQRFTRGTCIF